MPAVVPSSPRNASDTRRGLVSTAAQTFAGAKTFLARIVASLGITSGAARLDLRSDLGAGATDVCSVVGTTLADGSVNSLAKLFSVRTGLGGTEVERLAFNAQGVLSGGSLFYIQVPSDGGGYVAMGLCRLFGNNFTGNIFGSYNGAASVFGLNTATGRIDQSGTDSTGTPGAATINKPTGKSAIAAGASSVVITNSLVTAASRVIITPHARDATCKEIIAVPAAGFFTVSGTANATAALPFSWQVAEMM
jgi:hypothetical protein